MSEKRFVYEEEHFPIALQQIRDTLTDKTYDLEEVCEKLNKQQAIIEQLKKDNEKLQKRLQQIVENYNMTLKLDKEVYNKIRRLEKENMQLRQQNNELKLIIKQHEFAEKEGFK